MFLEMLTFQQQQYYQQQHNEIQIWWSNLSVLKCIYFTLPGGPSLPFFPLGQTAPAGLILHGGPSVPTQENQEWSHWFAYFIQKPSLIAVYC